LGKESDSPAFFIIHDQVQVMVDPEIAYRNQTQYFFQPCLTRGKIEQSIGGVIEKVPVKDRVIIVKVHGQRKDMRLYQILKEMSTKGRLRGRADALTRQLY
jgi:hypothetical protein